MKRIFFIFVSAFLACCSVAYAKEVSYDFEYSKIDTDFARKNAFSIDISNLNFRSITGIRGYVITTSPNNTESVTLLSLAYARGDHCPSYGEKIESYADYSARYPNQIFYTKIIKMAKGGTTNTPISITLKNPLNIPANTKCLIALWDGTNFANVPYSIKSRIIVDYNDVPAEPQDQYIASLDAEFYGAASLDSRALNAYVALPVSDSGPLFPGRLLDVYGNVAATTFKKDADKFTDTTKWGIEYFVTIFRNNSCQKTFPNHSAAKFMYNTKSMLSDGKRSTPFDIKDTFNIYNKSIYVVGNGSTMSEFSSSDDKYMSISNGDCVVLTFAPAAQTSAGLPAINQESQIQLLATKSH